MLLWGLVCLGHLRLLQLTNTNLMPKSDLILPSNIDCERFILASVLLDDSHYALAAERLESTDFVLDKHRLIWRSMASLAARCETIDRMTVYNELIAYGHAEGIGGLTYLTSLDDGMPRVANIESYIRIVKEKSALRQIIFTAQKQIDRAALGQESSSDISSDGASALMGVSILSGTDRDKLQDPGEVIRDVGIEELLNPKRSGIQTGWLTLDDYIYGLENKKIYLFGGGTTHGKSSALMQIAASLAAREHPVLYITPEMGKEELLQRVICARSKVSLYRAKHGYLNLMERGEATKAASEICKWPLFIDDHSGPTIGDIYRRIARAKREQKIEVVFLDYLQRVNHYDSGTGLKFRDEREALTYIMDSLAEYAKRLDLPIVVASQFSRARGRRVEKDQKPKLSDLFGSAALEHNSHVIVFIYREELDRRDRTDLKGKAEFIIAKNRAGRLGTILMTFEGKYTTFIEPTSALPMDEES